MAGSGSTRAFDLCDEQVDRQVLRGHSCASISSTRSAPPPLKEGMKSETVRVVETTRDIGATSAGRIVGEREEEPGRQRDGARRLPTTHSGFDERSRTRAHHGVAIRTVLRCLATSAMRARRHRSTLRAKTLAGISPSESDLGCDQAYRCVVAVTQILVADDGALLRRDDLLVRRSRPPGRTPRPYQARLAEPMDVRRDDFCDIADHRQQDRIGIGLGRILPGACGWVFSRASTAALSRGCCFHDEPEILHVAVCGDVRTLLRDRSAGSNPTLRTGCLIANGVGRRPAAIAIGHGREKNALSCTPLCSGCCGA